MTSPIRDEANPFTCEVDLRSLLDSPREIADEILDLTTLLGVLLAGDDADTCLPGIYRINATIFERATALKEAPAMQLARILIMIWRLRLARWSFRIGRFFADLGQRIYSL